MTKQIDIRSTLASKKQIADIWGTEDFQEVRPDLDTDEAWELLQEVERRCSAEFGINNRNLREIGRELYTWADTKD